jgi:hypothetical protein
LWVWCSGAGVWSAVLPPWRSPARGQFLCNSPAAPGALGVCVCWWGLETLLNAPLSRASHFFRNGQCVNLLQEIQVASKAARGRDRTSIVPLLHSRFHRCRTRPRAAKHPARCRPSSSDSSSGQERSPAPKSKLIVIEANAHCMDGASAGLGEMAVDTHCC